MVLIRGDLAIIIWLLVLKHLTGTLFCKELYIYLKEEELTPALDSSIAGVFSLVRRV
jgi:hypothetical protein